QRARGAGPLRRRARARERRRARGAAPHRHGGPAVSRFGLLLALAALPAGCRVRASADETDAGGVHGAVAVQTAAATAQPFARVVRAIGTVTPRPGRFAELAAPGPTRVARIFVAPDQRVAAGDTLIEFERAPFDAAAQSAATALATAQRNYTRAARLVQAGILPQKDSDQAASELAQAQVAAVTARRAQQLATLRAPLAGVVTRMTAVTGVAAAVDSLTRAVAVRARLRHPARALRLGESLVGRIVTAVVPRAVTVPVAALVPAAGGEGFQVFVVDSERVAHVRPVTVGGRSEVVA